MAGLAVYRVLHFVYGGGHAGSTRVAMDLAMGHKQNGLFEPFVVLRGYRGAKRSLLEELAGAGIGCAEVTASSEQRIVEDLVRITREIQPDVVVAHGYHEHLWGRRAARIAGVRVIIQVEHNRERYPPRRYLSAMMLDRCTDRIVCVSEGVRASLARRGFNRRKMQVIYNGISVPKFVPRDNRPYAARQRRVLSVARFCRQKDQPTLIRAAGILKEQGIECEILLAGGGSARYLQRCSRLVGQLELDGTVRFLGPRDDIPALLHDSMISVLSTNYEGLGLAILEGMAAGCLVIGSDVMGVRELIRNGGNGFLVRPRRPRELAAKIGYALEHVEYSARLAASGRDFVQAGYSLERMTRAYEELFLQMMARKGGRR